MRRIILAVLALSMSATAALAITVDINGTDYTSANAARDYDFIRNSNGSGDSGANHINIVDYILNNRLGAGDHTYTLVNGTSYANPTDTWFSNGAVSILINEIAGYAPTNTFGYYTAVSTGPVLNNLFPGPAGPGATNSFTLSSPAEFGFYLGVPNTGNTYFTDKSLNVAQEIHAAIFQIDNSNSYIIGFEDLRLGSSDKDYQDMIVGVTINSAPVPEPSTIILLGAGLGGLAFWRRKKS